MLCYIATILHISYDFADEYPPGMSQSLKIPHPKRNNKDGQSSRETSVYMDFTSCKVQNQPFDGSMSIMSRTSNVTGIRIWPLKNYYFTHFFSISTLSWYLIYINQSKVFRCKYALRSSCQYVPQNNSFAVCGSLLVEITSVSSFGNTWIAEHCVRLAWQLWEAL